jgi:ribonuclease HI
MDLLQSMQRADFPLWLYRHPARQLLVHIASLINQRAADGVATRLVKVKAHEGDPLNEAADTLAADAAELDPSHSQEVDPEGVHFGACALE